MRELAKQLQAGASMEPLFFKAENSAMPGTCPRQGQSFNGAAFFQSGKSYDFTYSQAFCVSFNGAAFFQSGKCRVRRCLRSEKRSFNGAAFFQSGK